MENFLLSFLALQIGEHRPSLQSNGLFDTETSNLVTTVQPVLG